jgi:Forkhead domain/FHA domain
MSLQVVAAPMVGHDVSRPTETRSPSPPEDLISAQAHDTTFDQQHSLPEHSNKSPSFLSNEPSHLSDVSLSTHQHDQATFEQTQRAVGNLLDALRTNNGHSHVVEDATNQPSSSTSENALNNTEPKRPSVSPLEPQSPVMSGPTSAGFTFPGAQALDDSLSMLPADEFAVSTAHVPLHTETQSLPPLPQSQDPPNVNPPEQSVEETIEEELPLNVQTAQDTGQISAFAKLEFDDGPFYITTYSLELGRDARAYRAAKARLAEQRAPLNGEGSSSGNSHPSSKNKREGGSQVKGSVVSDRGGFYGVDDIEGEAQEADEERQRQQEANGTQSSNHSASSIVNPKDLYTQPPLPHFDYRAYPIDEYERDIEEIPAPVTSEHFPEQEEGFLLPIHHAPVKDDVEQDVANHRSVSRRHAKIFWEDDCFKFHVKGVNGTFVDEVHYPKGAIVPLRSDVSIQIKGIKFQFKLPVHRSIESSEDSDQVEDDSPNQNAESSSATSGVERTVSPNRTGQTPLKVKIKNFKRSSPPPAQPILGPDGKPKRRGPGRPPKDGIMSKRERTAKERADRDAAAKAANGGITPEPPSNRGRTGRATIKNVPEAEEPKPVKRKYTKRKSANQDPDDLTPKLEEEDSEGAVDDAPPTKRTRINRSESPDYPKLEGLSEKDLQRPPYNYSILIYDLLKDSPKPLDLKGIYRGLKMKWPHFLYRYKDAKGWESSVRHNVNEDKLKIIEKVDRVGKGYSYRAKPGVDIEQHKKKRARSPPAAQKMSAPPQQRYQPQAHPPPPGAYTYPPGHQPPPGNHGMYGHLVPTTVPQGSMPYAMSYPPATAGPYTTGAMTPAPQYATSGPPPPQTAYTMTIGAQSMPITASAYPTPPTPNQPPPIPYNDQQRQPPNPPNPSTYPSNPQQNPPPLASYQIQQHQTPPIPAPPPGVSPFSPFLPTGLSVISTFESSLLEGVENSADKPRIRATLDSVRQRVFDGASGSSLPGGETQDERTFLHYFRHILENERFRNPGFVGWEAVRRKREEERMMNVAVAGLQQTSNVGMVGGLLPTSAAMGLRGGNGGAEQEDVKKEGEEEGRKEDGSNDDQSNKHVEEDEALRERGGTEPGPRHPEDPKEEEKETDKPAAGPDSDSSSAVEKKSED